MIRQQRANEEARAQEARQRGLAYENRKTENKSELQRLGEWTGGKRKFVFVNGATIKPKAVEWLWEGWIAKGFINIVAGETGAGKSSVIADVVSRITTGHPWPGEEEHRAPGQVVWLGSEDPLDLITVPRLMAVNANVEHVNFIQGAIRDGKALAVSLQDDFGSMMDALTMARDCGHPIDLVVIDPVTSYLSGGVLRKVDMNDAGQIRTVLEPWTKLASVYNVAIVCVTHFAKDTNRAMLHRVLGSGAFTALARSTISIAKLPDAAQNGDPWAKAMFQIKSNLPEQPEGGYRFSTRKTTVHDEDGRPITTTMVEWDELDGALKPENLIGGERGPVSQYGITFPLWLKAQFVNLPDSGLPVASLKQQAIDDLGISASWWERHSADYMEKRNIGGMWYCRPR